MRENTNNSPPKWAERLLSWYCKPELLEDLQGDLNEYFDRNVKKKGRRQARWIYVIDVFKFFRLYTIRKPAFINLLIQWIMLGSYIKSSGRSMMRNKLFSGINVIGLAVSMSVGLLLIGLLSDMFSYDRFHVKGDHIYRVISKYSYLEQEDRSFYASTSPRAGKEIKENVPGIEAITCLYNNFSGDVKVNDEKTVPLNGLWADEAFFKVFSFSMVQGNPETALKEAFSIVLSETAAKKLFGDGQPLGKIVTLFNTREFTVTGVVKDPPKFSHIKFEMLGSLSTRDVIEKENWEQEMSWVNIWQGYTYILLPEGADLANIQNNLDVLCERLNATVKNSKVRLSLQPLYDIALGEDLNNSLGLVMGIQGVWMTGGLAIIVILSACFNYTNLSIARATRRSREVGIRKVVGALRRQVLMQFVVEAVIISMLALVIAFLLFLLLKPYFLSLEPKMHDMLDLNLSLKVILGFIVFAALVGVAAGLLPAILFSKINAIKALKDVSTLRLFRHLNLRKSLIVIQYVISLAFITSTVIGFKQYKYLLSFDLGYNTENIINIEMQGNKPDLVMKELKELPEVESISRSLMITSVGNYWGTKMKYVDPLDSANVYYNGIDEMYIPLHDIKLLAGRNFTPRPDSVEESEVIVNQEVLKRFKIGDGDPLKAIDEIVTVDRKKMKIIGVVKDFYYSKADNRNSEVLLRYNTKRTNFLNVKVSTTDWLVTLSKIESAWKKIDNVHPMEAQLYSDRIAFSYREISAMLQMMGFVSFLAVCIAFMGLLGMVIFITETRLKEISIRKVLGASDGKLIYLLSKGFMVMLFISGTIALPITYLFFDQVAFVEMANHDSISLIDLSIGFLGVLIIALLMIGSQTFKVARSNPAEILKNE